jgi:hypothetical protein
LLDRIFVAKPTNLAIRAKPVFKPHNKFFDERWVNVGQTSLGLAIFASQKLLTIFPVPALRIREFPIGVQMAPF